MNVRALYLAGLLLILTALLLWALYELRLVLVIMFFGIIIAEALAPGVDRLEQLRVPRVVAVLLIYALFLGLLGLVIWLVVPPLTREIGNFALRIPAYVDQLLLALAPYLMALQESGLIAGDSQVPAQVSEAVVGWVLRATVLPIRAFSIIAGLFGVVFISIVLVISGAEVRSFLVSFLRPHQQTIALEVLRRIGRRLGHFVRAQLILMSVVGGLVYLGLVVLGVPFPLLLGVLAFFGEAIPIVGPVVTAVPGIFFGLTVSPLLALKAAILYIVVQQLENYLLVPFVYAHQVELHALLVFVAILIGSSLMGVLGALIAVPVVVALQVVFEELVIPWRKGQFASGAQPGEELA